MAVSKIDKLKERLEKHGSKGTEELESIEIGKSAKKDSKIDENKYKTVNIEGNTSKNELNTEGTKELEKDKTIKKMESAFGLEFSEEQVKIIQHKDAPLNVLAGAGSGKTTILVAKMLYREIVDKIKPLNMIAITFTSKARYEMEERYYELRERLGLKQKGKPTFRTFHALFLMLLQSMDQYTKVNVLASNRYMRQLSSMVVVGSEDSERSKVLEEMFTYRGNLINKGLSTDGVQGSEVHHRSTDTFDIENYKRVMLKYSELKKNDGYIDFDDMQTIIHDEIINKGNTVPVEAFRRVWGKGDVYIDEYQDISKLQRVIMDALIKNYNSFTVIGDDDQSIYSWRGSDPSFIIDFIYQYTNAVRLNLSVNYRCKSNILKPILPVIENNKKRVGKDIKPHYEGGIVETLPIGDSYKPLLSQLLEELQYYEGVMFKEIAVLVRQNSQRILLADGLIERGIPVNIVNERHSLQQTPLYKNIMEIIEMIKKQDNTLFIKHARKILPHLSRDLIQKYNHTDKTWYEDVVNGGYYNVKRSVVKNIRKLRETSNMYNVIVLVWKLIKSHYKQITSRGYGSYVRVVEIIKYLLEISKGVTYKEFLDIEDRKQSRVRLWVNSEEALRIDTLHSVKGLEFDTVYLVGVDNNIIPDMGRYETYLKEGGKEEAENYIEEERRLFYVGWTRAKERLVVSYNKKKPSMFLKELEM